MNEVERRSQGRHCLQPTKDDSGKASRSNSRYFDQIHFQSSPELTHSWIAAYNVSYSEEGRDLWRKNRFCETDDAISKYKTYILNLFVSVYCSPWLAVTVRVTIALTQTQVSATVTHELKGSSCWHYWRRRRTGKGRYGCRRTCRALRRPNRSWRSNGRVSEKFMPTEQVGAKFLSIWKNPVKIFVGVYSKPLSYSIPHFNEEEMIFISFVSAFGSKEERTKTRIDRNLPASHGVVGMKRPLPIQLGCSGLSGEGYSPRIFFPLTLPPARK